MNEEESGPGGASEELYRRAGEGDQDAREKLLCEHRPLVRAIMRRFSVPPSDREDVLQAGFVGLLQAIDGYEPERGHAFSTYAVPLILGQMKRYLRGRSAVSISRHRRSTLRRVREVQKKLAAGRKHPPSVAEIAREMGYDAEEIALVSEALRAPRPLDGVAGTLVGKRPDGWVDSLALQQAIDELSPRHQQILRMRYFSDLTQQEVADLLDISQPHVSRLEREATLRLSCLLRSD